MYLLIITQLLIHITNQLDFQEIVCDINIPGTICLNDGMMKISKPYSSPDAFGFWNFDHELFVDIAQHHHLTKRQNIHQVQSRFGFGNAAQFFKTENSQLHIYFVPFWAWEEWTLTFMLYLEEITKAAQEDETLCNWIDIYDETFQEKSKVANLKIGFEAGSRKVVVWIEDSREQKKKKKGEDEVTQILKSKSRLQPQMWYRIYITRNEQNKISLYINGFFEVSTTVKNLQAIWKHMVIGFQSNESICTRSFVMDSLKMMTRTEEDAFIQADSDQFQGFSSFIYLNCEDCSQSQASSCSRNYHLCTSLELFSYGIKTAREMGWSQNGNFWSEDSNIDEVPSGMMGTGLCCLNIDYV